MKIKQTNLPPKNRHAVILGRRGGKRGTGDSKRRLVTTEQARAAAAARWAKARLSAADNK